jgi:hypothetical protein
MRKLLLSLMIFGFIDIAYAEKFGTNKSEENNLKIFKETNLELYESSKQLKAIWMSYDRPSKKEISKAEISKTMFIEDNIRSLLDVQFNRTVTLLWSLTLALDIEKRDSIKIASAFLRICSAPSESFMYTAPEFGQWKKITMEVANEEGFNKTELSLIKNSLDSYAKSLQSTDELCKRAEVVDNW